MPCSDRIRQWGRAGVFSVLCVASAAASPQSPAPTTQPAAKPAKPAVKTPAKSTKTAASPARQSSKPATRHATGNRTSGTGKSSGKSARGKKIVTKRGQQGIDPARSREIQAALIRQNYLKGDPSGSWDAATQDAMRRFQADHGWQSKTIPDSRALIRLGLGPSSDHLLNPESAMTAAPAGDSKAGAKTKDAAPADDPPKQ